MEEDEEVVEMKVLVVFEVLLVEDLVFPGSLK